jgi:transposase
VPMSGPKAFSHTVVASTRRSWAAWEKRAIVDEAQRATDSISAVARRHGITPSLLFRWRRELRRPEQSAEPPPAPAFVPLVLPAPVETPRPPEESRGGVVEVEWAGGRVRIAGPVDLTTLVAVLGILAGRR